MIRTMKRLLMFTICVITIGLLFIAFTNKADAKTNISSNVEALLVPDYIPSIVCHAGCQGTYPDVGFCVMCRNCQLIMYFIGIGSTDVCGH